MKLRQGQENRAEVPISNFTNEASRPHYFVGTTKELKGREKYVCYAKILFLYNIVLQFEWCKITKMETVCVQTTCVVPKTPMLLTNSSLAWTSGSRAWSRSAWSQTLRQPKGEFRPEKPAETPLTARYGQLLLLQGASLNKHTVLSKLALVAPHLSATAMPWGSHRSSVTRNQKWRIWEKEPKHWKK